jgi:hypothetical protein
LSRHTPGPWHGEPLGTTGIYSGPPVDHMFSGHRIASVEGPTSVGPGSFQEYAANLRLIVAAPCMFELIEGMVAAAWSVHPEGLPMALRSVVARAESLLGSVRGETPCRAR